MMNSLLPVCYPERWVSHAAPCQPPPLCAQFAVAMSAQASPHCTQSLERGWSGTMFAEPASNHS